MVIEDLLPGKAEIITLAVILSLVFSYEIINVVKRVIGFLKR
jgi:hypothetical protein